MTDKRDPRVDPKPGDVLAKSGRRRQVRKVWGATGYVEYFSGMFRRFGMKLDNWRKWAKNAEVIHAAE